MRNLSTVARIALAAGACLLVFFITREVYRDEAKPPVESSTVLLEQVRKVMKLVTVEGDFNELYSREDSWNYNDWLARLPGFKKRIMLRVKARASVGYDLSGSRLTTDEESHTIYLDLYLSVRVGVAVRIIHLITYRQLFVLGLNGNLATINDTNSLSSHLDRFRLERLSES